MYKFIIKTKNETEYEGIASELEILEELVKIKLSSINMPCNVKICKGKKILSYYEFNI
jgi:hypothetical protein